MSGPDCIADGANQISFVGFSQGAETDYPAVSESSSRSNNRCVEAMIGW